ncbi:MAG: WecB/TagA/CpsF family glycosyltransferase [Lachnospiraceae bacterium]|nr:WecB/TagA/CpsF family glycosyltransferase [Lachnospiraceae bacterium]
MNLESKKTVGCCKILGVEISTIDMARTLAYIEEHFDEMKGKYICVSNVHTTVMSDENKKYMSVQNGAELALPDGKPLSVVCKKRGFKNVARVTGPELMEEIFKISAQKNYSHYFYGSTDETLLQLKRKLLDKYPGIQIAGMYSPPFRELTIEEDEKIVGEINKLSPDFVWVGLGAPKQEIWMAKHKEKVLGIMVGVGAGFDYHAGNIKRAPKWMQKCSLEWFYRLAQDPKRLFKRYMTTNFKFILKAVILGK